ncbi:MAG TPA: SDR family NAD(P)-dependent oxidoreductase [Steroidobacteraceae bacterium]|jgi:NAD(P)-dependent dehydrogenase (short-subunit alcohol dehydrogenase family)|nr:SDR family NAD(P)-dependent oxidoreductase [Steroidobacteraceae bacterium]
MTKSIHFGRRSTADHVLAGIDLTGKHILVTGCNSGLGLETMNAFAANGASVIGLARTHEAASRACAQASPVCIPVGCDLSNFDSIAAALDTIRGLLIPLDAIVANAAAVNRPSLQTRYGVEEQFLTNHLGHFMLVNGVADLLRDGSARIVLVSSGASISQAPIEGIMFDNLDGRRFYDPSKFYAQSKLANSLYAKELSRRLAARGIAVNSADPGAARTRTRKGLFTRLFAKTAAQAAATQAFLAASPEASGITGEYWSNCKISEGNALLQDTALAGRLWDVSQEILDRQGRTGGAALLRAA